MTLTVSLKKSSLVMPDAKAGLNAKGSLTGNVRHRCNPAKLGALYLVMPLIVLEPVCCPHGHTTNVVKNGQSDEGRGLQNPAQGLQISPIKLIEGLKKIVISKQLIERC